MTWIRRTLIGATIWIAACTHPVEELRDGGKTYDVYFLAGQSNMEGYGHVEDLPPELLETLESVPIFMGNMPPDHRADGGLGVWGKLAPGFAREYGSNGKRNRLSKYFGPELSFARELQRLEPDREIAIVKYARSGSTLAVGASHGGNWQPDYLGGNGLNQFDFAMNTLERAFATDDIDGDGLRDTLRPAGIVWMQGEGDAENESSAEAYLENLTYLMYQFRRRLNAPGLAIVIGKITDSGMNETGTMMPYIEVVHTAQENFVKRDRCAAYASEIDTLEHARDGWHYTSDAYIEMGRIFAARMHALKSDCVAGSS